MIAMALLRQQITQRQTQENKVEVSPSNHLQGGIQNKHRVKTQPIPKVSIEQEKI